MPLVKSEVRQGRTFGAAKPICSALLAALAMTIGACGVADKPFGASRESAGTVSRDETGSSDGGSEEDYWCPYPYITGALVPGNVAPGGHAVKIGNAGHPLEWQAVVEVSPTGLNKGKYELIPGVKFYSEDKKVYVTSGIVEGWCWFKKIPGVHSLIYGSTGSLQVTAFQGSSTPSGPPSAKPQIEYNGTSSTTLSLALPAGASADVLFSGGASTPGNDGDGAPQISGYSWSSGGVSIGSGSEVGYSATADETIRLMVTSQEI